MAPSEPQKNIGDTRRKSLEKRLDAIQQKVAAGASRLLAVPDNLVADATAALEKLKEEQTAVARQLAELPAGSDKRTGQNDTTYLQAVKEVGKKILKGKPEQVNAALRAVGVSMLLDRQKDAVAVLVCPDSGTCPKRSHAWSTRKW